MKHGTRFWQKKLNRNQSHRDSLMGNMLSQLIHHEQISTTLAKAKFIKHEMESDTKISFPKLVHIISKRYASQSGGYVRILKNGFRASGSDRAPLAFIEFVHNPNDIVYHMAQKQGSVINEQLGRIQAEKYTNKLITVVDLKTGTPTTIQKLVPRQDILQSDRKKFSGIERSIHKRIMRFNKSLNGFPKARQVDEESTRRLKELVELGGVDLKVGVEALNPAPRRVKLDLQLTLSEKAPGKEMTKKKPEIKAPIVPQSFFQRFFGKRSYIE